jgi:hypothetical protein
VIIVLAVTRVAVYCTGEIVQVTSASSPDDSASMTFRCSVRSFMLLPLLDKLFGAGVDTSDRVRHDLKPP